MADGSMLSSDPQFSDLEKFRLFFNDLEISFSEEYIDNLFGEKIILIIDKDDKQKRPVHVYTQAAFYFNEAGNFTSMD